MKMKKWILSTIFAFALAFALTTPSSVAEASGVTSGISYIDENGNQQTYTGSYTTVTDSSSAVTWGHTGGRAWYVVSSDENFENGITVNGTVYLIVKDGCTLTVKNELSVNSNSTLIIYGETATSGTIVAEGTSQYKAGIGKGGTVIINSGTVTATGGSNGAGIGGDGEIIINGGIVTATGNGGGAGIGGNNGGTCGTVTINGGIVTATGRNGIGCGNAGYNGNITINGGTVTATSSSTGYGIGSGTVFLTISGGYVKAVTSSFGESAICGEEIRVTGGYFADSSATVGISGTGKVYGCDVAFGYSVNINEEADTKDAYPYVVMQTLAVTWVDGNGNKLQTDEVAYGAVPTAYSGDTPTKTASGSEFYTFTGWDKELSAVTANTTYTAQFAVSTITAASGSGGYTSATWAADDVTITLADTSQSVTGYQYSTDGGSTWIDLDTTNGSATLTVSDATAGTDYLFRGVTASGTGAASSFTVKIDRTDPVIGGIEDGLIYCEDVSFTVTEDNLDVVTVNGAAVTEYTLQADGLTYEVIAYDQAGNSTVCTVTVNSGHTEGEAVSENEAAATCTESGSYDSVVYCTVCGEELNRETVTVSATGHSYTSTVIAPAYTEQGYTLHTCVICGYSYKTDYTDILVLDGTDGSVSTKTTVQELTAVPEGLKNLYSSVDALISDLIKRVIAVGTGYTADNTLVYDVVLQYSTDGGATWITATVDNFPTTGIAVTLPYPNGTDASFEFTVLHMFTETSSRLGITAGGTETPTVTKTADGLAVTLTGLSPVALSWKEGTVTSNTTTEDEPTESETIEAETSDTSSQTDETASTEISVTSASSTTAAPTGDNSHTALWLVLLLISGIGVVTAIAFHRRKKTR